MTNTDKIRIALGVKSKSIKWLADELNLTTGGVYSMLHYVPSDATFTRYFNAIGLDKKEMEFYKSKL